MVLLQVSYPYSMIFANDRLLYFRISRYVWTGRLQGQILIGGGSSWLLSDSLMSFTGSNATGGGGGGAGFFAASSSSVIRALCSKSSLTGRPLLTLICLSIMAMRVATCWLGRGSVRKFRKLGFLSRCTGGFNIVVRFPQARLEGEGCLEGGSQDSADCCGLAVEGVGRACNNCCEMDCRRFKVLVTNSLTLITLTAFLSI